jgi:hypothetical protein
MSGACKAFSTLDSTSNDVIEMAMDWFICALSGKKIEGENK